MGTFKDTFVMKNLHFHCVIGVEPVFYSGHFRLPVVSSSRIPGTLGHGLSLNVLCVLVYGVWWRSPVAHQKFKSRVRLVGSPMTRE